MRDRETERREIKREAETERQKQRETDRKRDVEKDRNRHTERKAITLRGAPSITNKTD